MAHRIGLSGGPDDVNGPSFQGGWQLSYRAVSANLTPLSKWTVPDGSWLAGEVRGTKLQTFGQSESPIEPELVDAKANTLAGKVRIFTNRDRASPYLYIFGAGALVAGNDVQFEPEAWQALPFTPRADVHATTLAAAIAWESGTRLINLGIYNDSAGAPGTPLPGGQGSTGDIPDLGQCVN